MNSKGLGEFVVVQRDMTPAEERIIFVRPRDIELGTGNSQSLNIRVSKPAGYLVNDIVKVLPKKAGSRLVFPFIIREINVPVGEDGKYVNVVVVPEGDLAPIPTNFAKALDEGVYLDGRHRDYNPEERQLRIDLGLARVIRDPTDIAPFAPYPRIPNGFTGVLDADNDGVIGTDEARKFVEGAIDRIKGGGLKFSELAQGISDGLRVNNIQVNPPQRVYIDRIFNGVSLQVRRQEQVRRQDFAEWLDIPAGQLQRNQFTGTEFDSGTGDVGSVDLKATLEEARSEFQELVRQLGDARVREPLTEIRWYRPTCYITMIDKTEGDLVMSRREVETIKKIKKCGKCFYRIVLTDDGVVSSIRNGNYGESILKFIMLPPYEE